MARRSMAIAKRRNEALVEIPQERLRVGPAQEFVRSTGAVGTVRIRPVRPLMGGTRMQQEAWELLVRAGRIDPEFAWRDASTMAIR